MLYQLVVCKKKLKLRFW